MMYGSMLYIEISHVGYAGFISPERKIHDSNLRTILWMQWNSSTNFWSALVRHRPLTRQVQFMIEYDTPIYTMDDA